MPYESTYQRASYMRYEILDALLENGPMTCKQLAARLNKIRFDDYSFWTPKEGAVKRVERRVKGSTQLGVPVYDLEEGIPFCTICFHAGCEFLEEKCEEKTQ